MHRTIHYNSFNCFFLLPLWFILFLFSHHYFRCHNFNSSFHPSYILTTYSFEHSGKHVVFSHPMAFEVYLHDILKYLFFNLVNQNFQNFRFSMLINVWIFLLHIFHQGRLHVVHVPQAILLCHQMKVSKKILTILDFQRLCWYCW